MASASVVRKRYPTGVFPQFLSRCFVFPVPRKRNAEIGLILSFSFTEAKAASSGGGQGKGFALKSFSEVRRLLQHRKPPVGAQPTNHLFCRWLLIEDRKRPCNPVLQLKL